MGEVSLAKARAELSALVERVMGGETISITRRGKAVATLTGVERAPVAIDIEKLKALTAGMRRDDAGDGTFIAGLRDDARY